jgi:lipopolysaccharide export system protein LptC
MRVEPNADLGMHPVVAAESDRQTVHPYWTMGRGDPARALRAARRHSRLVRALRVAVPLAVVLGLGLVTLVTYFNPLRMLGKLPIDVSNLVISGTKITMEQPRLAGFTRDARAYDLTATAAAQDMTKPNIVELTNIRAKVQMQDKSLMQLTANTGTYDTKSEILKLDKNILLISSTGYQGELSEAVVDIRKGHVVSDQPVVVKMLQGRLNAKRLEIFNSGELVRFDGGVDMVMKLEETAAPQDKAGTP